MKPRETPHNIKRAVVAFGLTVLVGCGFPGDVDKSLKPQARPAAAAQTVVARPTSAGSAALRAYFSQVEQAQLAQGLLRQDGGGRDTPFTADMLARNFEQIAFYNEYDGGFTGPGGQSPLRRWSAPVRIGAIFGPSVLPSQRRSDMQALRSYAARLGNVTGHRVATGGRANFIVIFASEDDRAAALAEAASRLGLPVSSLRPFQSLRRDTYCAVAAFALGSDPNTYTAAVAVIRTENPDLLRLSCLHEELAQGMGLANDSPAARPSIFNDDDEFALLTRHDELLLRLLYDARLRPGMSARQAAPLTRIIAREILAGPL